MHTRVFTAGLVALVLLTGVSHAQEQQTPWGERLGYPAGKKVLMFHADDIGMCHEANQAAKAYLKEGHIQSAAAMVPCGWFDEFVAWTKKNPGHDVGLHLTLTSEWRHYRWAPVSPKGEVPGLVDKDGYLPHTVPEVAIRATPAEVEREVRAQVERALSRGLRPTHLDTHMGTLFARAEFTHAYLKVAQEYRIPAMVIELTPKRIAQFRKQGYPLTPALLDEVAKYPGPKLDDFRALPKADSYVQLKEKLFALVRGLDPGITEVIFHPSVKTEALQAITGSWLQRSWEAKLFADPEVKRFLTDEGVLFTDYPEMLRRFEDSKRAPVAKPHPKIY